MKFETQAIHEFQKPDPQTGAVITPLYLTSTYGQEAVGVHKGFEYSRTGNPTRSVLENLLASLEGGKYGLSFASGVAATTAVLSQLRPGDHVVVGNDIYGGTYRLFEKVFKPWGIEATYVPQEATDAFSRAVQKNTKLFWIETPTNPLLKLADIRKISEISRAEKILFAVDNTFVSPYFQRPLELGADLVIHSTTKYIAGHSDLIGGAVVTSNKELYDSLRFYQNAAGAVPGAFDSWLTLRGIKTLALRMKQHEANALIIARYLEKHPRVEKVYYPGSPSHPQYALAQSQMSGFGGMLSFELDGDVKAVNEFFSRLRYFTLAESLGGVESLACYPPQMTHGSIPAEERFERGIKDTLIRLSVGIEHSEDLLEDLEGALKNS